MTEKNKMQCLGCGADLALQATAAFAPEILTVAYKLDDPKRQMLVEDFCDSLKALAKSLKLAAKELGTKVVVGIHDLKVIPGEVSASVCVVEVGKEDNL